MSESSNEIRVSRKRTAKEFIEQMGDKHRPISISLPNQKGNKERWLHYEDNALHELLKRHTFEAVRRRLYRVFKAHGGINPNSKLK